MAPRAAEKEEARPASRVSQPTEGVTGPLAFGSQVT